MKKEQNPTADRVYEDIDDPNKTGLAPYMTDPTPPKNKPCKLCGGDHHPFVCPKWVD